MADKDFQEKTITQSNTSVDFVSPPGNISISGTFDGAVIGQTLTGDTVEIATFNSASTFFANAQRLTFTATTPGASTDISIKWYPVRYPY